MAESYVYDRIKQITAHLNILKRNIKQDIIDINKERAKQHVIDIILLVREADFQRANYSQLDIVVDLLEMQIERIDMAADKKALEDVIERITNIFSEGKYKSDLSAYRECRRFRNIIDTENINYNSLRSIIKNERPLNVLAFDAPRKILEEKQFKDPMLNTYGICIDTSYGDDLVDNVAYGTGGNSNITNNAFDVVILMPNTSALYEPIGFRNDVIPKVEFMTIGTCLKYLRSEGLMSITMPYTRLDGDLCSYFARTFSDIHITKVNNILVEITGIKKVERVLDSECYIMLRDLYKNFKTLSGKMEHVYELPQQQLVIQSFRGSRITDEMLESVRSKSSSIDRVIASSNEIDDLANHKPLLPFNTGQVGLVLASGCLDGVVHEDEEHCHLIKGRVERKTVTKKGKRGADDEITVYHSVQINALTPDGKLIEIS